MPSYELIYIVNPNISEEILPESINKVNEIITKAGGSIVETIQWGRKKLAYPIKRSSEGNYILTKVETDTTSIRKIDTNLKMNDDILRHLVIRANV